MRGQGIRNRAGMRRDIVAVAGVSALVTGIVVAVSAPPAAAATANPTPAAGQRKSATRLPFAISGSTALSVDVGTGNALVTDQLLTLPGVTQDLPLTLAYNSSVFGSAVPSAVTGSAGSGWAITGFDQRLVSNADGSLTYYGPAGLSGVFASNGAGGYTAPAQFQADLTGSSTAGWTLTNHGNREKLTFNTSGRLVTDKDRNGNAVTYAFDTNGLPASITSSRGPVAGRKVTVTTSSNRITKLTQTSGTLTRSVTFGYTSLGHLVTVLGTDGKTTTFDALVEGSSTGAPDTGEVLRIANPAGKSTYLTFTGTSPKKVASVAQVNPPIDHGAGESKTRLTYPSATQTLVADPTTNLSAAVDTVPHTTYNLTAGQLVASTTDPNGHARSRTYTTLGDVASTTPAAGGATTFSYGANGGESLTKVATPGGASGTAAYGNTGATVFLPSSSTNDAGNSLQYTYDGVGNTTAVQSGAAGPSAKVTYNTNGTAKTSASPGAAAGVSTAYAYDTDNDLQTITAPTGNSLAQRAFTWDGFGRLATATTGAGATLTYSYDNADRITKVDYSDTTVDVTYAYDANGRIKTRVDGSGTSTYTYDDLGHLSSTVNTANNQTVSYTYDLAGALASTANGLGTTSYGYDAAHQLTSISYPQGGSTYVTRFANDNQGRRVDVWLQANTDHSSWDAHEHYTYDNSGRVSKVLGENGPATAPTTTVNETVCYATGVTPQNCASAATTADRARVQSTYDSVSGETNTYTYNGDDRLTKDVVTGGSNPRTYTYGYDTAGNRTTSSVTGTSPSSQTLTFNNANQISTSGYTYDGAGNLTTSPNRSATFNAAGQQVSTSKNSTTSTYTYAGTNNNELLSQVVPGDRTYSLAYGRTDRNGLPVVDSVTASGVGTGYVITDPDGVPIMLGTSTGNTVLYLYDGINNPVVLSANSATSQAFAYDPFGAQTKIGGSGFSSSYQNPYAFQTGFKDRFTNEVKFGQRYYNPGTGSWTQQDALNAPLNPKNANRYAYVDGDPVNQTDPTGQSILSCIGGALSLAGGLIEGGALIAGEVGSGGLSTPVTIGLGGMALGLIGTGLGLIDSC